MQTCRWPISLLGVWKEPCLLQKIKEKEKIKQPMSAENGLSLESVTFQPQGVNKARPNSLITKAQGVVIQKIRLDFFFFYVTFAYSLRWVMKSDFSNHSVHHFLSWTLSPDSATYFWQEDKNRKPWKKSSSKGSRRALRFSTEDSWSTLCL